MSIENENLNNLIDQLVLWIRHNKGNKLSSVQKNRVLNILLIIQQVDELSEIEIKDLEKENRSLNKKSSQFKTPGKQILKKKGNKNRKKSPQLKAHIVRGGLPGLGKR